MSEKWKTIPDWPEYEASTEGRIRRAAAARGTQAGRLLKQTVNSRHGYCQVGLSRACKATTQRVHRLVCSTFYGPAPSPEHEVAHNDGDKVNCRPSNLRWATHQDNEEDKELHGTRRRGSTHGRAKIDEATALAILCSAGTQRAAAAQFGVSQALVSAIRSGKKWQHLQLISHEVT